MEHKAGPSGPQLPPAVMIQPLGGKAAWQWVLRDRLLSHLVGLLPHKTDHVHVGSLVKLSLVHAAR